MEWLQQSWVILAAVISGVTLIWKFVGTVKEIQKSINEPITKLDKKVSDLKETVEKNDKLQNEATQSLLRDRLLQAYYDCSREGFASISQKDNWENMYKHYHALGENGVMDSCREKMLALPEEKKTRKKQQLNEDK